MQAPCSVLMGLPIGTGFGAKLPGTNRLDPIELRKKQTDPSFHALGGNLCTPGPGQLQRQMALP